jgi:hypothetical protein
MELMSLKKLFYNRIPTFLNLIQNNYFSRFQLHSYFFKTYSQQLFISVTMALIIFSTLLRIIISLSYNGINSFFSPFEKPFVKISKFKYYYIKTLILCLKLLYLVNFIAFNAIKSSK